MQLLKKRGDLQKRIFDSFYYFSALFCFHFHSRRKLLTWPIFRNEAAQLTHAPFLFALREKSKSYLRPERKENAKGVPSSAFLTRFAYCSIQDWLRAVEMYPRRCPVSNARLQAFIAPILRLRFTEKKTFESVTASICHRKFVPHSRLVTKASARHYMHLPINSFCWKECRHWGVYDMIHGHIQQKISKQCA